MLKDKPSETLVVGMREGEYCCLSGSYLFQVLKGSVDALGCCAAIPLNRRVQGDCGREYLLCGEPCRG